MIQPRLESLEASETTGAQWRPATRPQPSLQWRLLVLAFILLQAVPLHGQDFVWARQMGGTGWDMGQSVAVDGGGNIYTTGFFEGTVDFDPGTGVFNLISAGTRDIFVSKLDSAGNFVYARRLGGIQNDQGFGIAVDSSGSVYTTGTFQGLADFDPGAGTSNLTSLGSSNDVFLSKLTGVPSNQAPTDISLSGNTVSENSVPGTSVGVFSGSDPNAGDTLIFTLVDDADGRFSIVGN
jgi:hypothetical protein